MEDSLSLAASLIRQLAKAIESLSDEDKAAIASGGATLRLSVEPKARVRRAPRSSSEEVDIASLRNRLESCQSREDAERMIEELALSKDALRQVTKALGLPYPKDDSMSRLVERIVESTVGFRLRSQAIQGRGDAPIRKEEHRTPSEHLTPDVSEQASETSDKQSDANLRGE